MFRNRERFEYALVFLSARFSYRIKVAVPNIAGNVGNHIGLLEGPGKVFIGSFAAAVTR